MSELGSNFRYFINRLRVMQKLPRHMACFHPKNQVRIFFRRFHVFLDLISLEIRHLTDRLANGSASRDDKELWGGELKWCRL